MKDLEKKVIEQRGKYNLVVTDGVFSMDGNIAPLPEIIKIAKTYGLLTMVDDAHGVGVLGKKGSGTIAYFNVSGDIDIQMGTLSKAIGSVGGYVAGSKDLIDYFRNISRSFMYSTALPPSTIAASLRAIEIIEEDKETREHLLQLADWFKVRLREAGFHVPPTQTAIIPVIVGEADQAVEYSHCLLEEGIYIPAIRPPTVPKGTSRLRISIMATHKKEDLERVITLMIKHGKRLGLIG